MSESSRARSGGRNEGEDDIGSETEGVLIGISVPPALGTRTNCACAPGNLGEPKSREAEQREVKPVRQFLAYVLLSMQESPVALTNILSTRQ